MNFYNAWCSSDKFSRIITNDVWGNLYSEFSLNSPTTSDFLLQQSYSGNTQVSLNNGFSSSATFPVSNIPLNISNDYAQPTANIQSNDFYISNKALTLTAGCTKMQDAVQKIARWVVGSINYSPSLNSNLDESASLVFGRKTGNCAGYTNLIIALLRSIGIPARFVTGVLLRYPYNVPFGVGGKVSLGSDGPDSHAVYAVYYPDKDEWIMADAQLSLDFCTTHFIAHQSGPDNCDKLITVSCLFSPSTNPPTMSPVDLCGEITSFDNKYVFDRYSFFQSDKQNKLLLSVFPGFATGINDRIEITNGTSDFKTGQEVSYSSTFTSNQGNTWPVNRFWSIDLYHTNGTYHFASQDNPQQLGSSWNIKTNPVLPDYQWLLDENGRIYGEVHIDVQLNDGDIVSAKMPLSIEECNDVIVSNQTYTSNTTITGCYVTIDNVSVQNNSNLTVDSEMGITISNNFTVNVGSTFETQ